MKVIKWGILGTGRIAGIFAGDLQFAEGCELVAVGSRSQEGADKFGEKFNVKHRHASYEALVQNPGVDVIYIATPHSMHYENALLCINHNKAVLCEKAFAINTRQALEMINLAMEKKVFLMEALWTKFLPHFIKTQEMIQQGVLGDIRSVLANFGFKPVAPVNPRLFEPRLGGGTLMDIGIYNVFLATSILGKPDHINAVMTPASTGVDEQCSIVFRYKNGAMAQLFSTFQANLATDADICGSEGRVRLTSRFYEPSATIQYYKTWNEMETVPVREREGIGYQYEARHVNECLRQGLTESPIIPFAETIERMETLDKIRDIMGVRYPEDDHVG